MSKRDGASISFIRLFDSIACLMMMRSFGGSVVFGVDAQLHVIVTMGFKGQSTNDGEQAGGWMDVEMRVRERVC